MNNVFDFFDEIWCINLDHRPDRWGQVLTEFEKIGIKERVQRFSGIYYEPTWKACSETHLELIKLAEKKRLNNILIFEDDVVFKDNVVSDLKNSLIDLEKIPWEFFFLGANMHRGAVRASPHLLKLLGAYSLHAYCVKNTLFDKILSGSENVPKYDFSQVIDIHYDAIISNYNIQAFSAYPLLATQRTSYSDIEKRVVTYDIYEPQYQKFKDNL